MNLGFAYFLAPGIVVDSFDAGFVVKDADSNDGESEDFCVGFEMASQGSFVIRECDVSVHPPIYDIPIDVKNVTRDGFFYKGPARRKCGIINDVDVMLRQRADTVYDYRISDFFFFNGFLQTSQQVGAVFQANDNNTAEIAIDCVNIRSGGVRSVP